MDVLRGVASLVVVFHHLFSLNFDKFKLLFGENYLIFSVLKYVSDLNHVAVLFFFLLSGYSIGIATKNYNLLSFIDTKKYYKKRAIRIIPLYIISILVCYMVGFYTNKLNDSSFTFYNLFGNLFFLQTPSVVKNTWFIPFGLNGPFWSLSYEVFFYLIFPIVIYLAFKISKLKFNIQFYQAGLFLSFIMSIASLLILKFIFLPYLSFASLFFIWFLGYYMYNINLVKLNNLDKTIFIGLILVFFISFLFDIAYYSATIYQLVIGVRIFLGWFLISSLFNKNTVNDKSVFVNTFFIPVGEGSFSIYLMHFPILLLAMYLFKSLLLITIFLIVGCYCLILIERKLISITKFFFG